MNVEAESNPFVGLRPFESHESLLFFGRQDQTLELLQRLHLHHFVAVIGSSGSGKSSLVRAGLIPRLQAGYLVNDRDRWVITIMKPGQTPICNLADALLADSLPVPQQLTPSELEQKIREEGVDAVIALLEPLWSNKFNFFLLVDQFEELFRFSLYQDNFEKKDEAKEFVNILLALAAQKDLPIYVVTTMRADFIGDCALIYGLPEAMNQSQYIVPRLNRVQMRNTIEGPVRLYNGRINAALTARLLNDVQLINDELPLLQHALMRMWDHKENVDGKGELDLEDYESIGGIEKALSNHADEAMQGMTPEEKSTTKRLFQALTTIDENGRKTRRPARLSELQALTGTGREQLLLLIHRFVEGNKSFLVVSNIPNTNDCLIDISHESLIRQWRTLSAWVDEEAEAGQLFLRLVDSTERYERKVGSLLTGNELQSVWKWFHTFKPDEVWAQRYSNTFPNTIRYLQKSQKQKRKKQAIVYTTVIGIVALLGLIAYINYSNNRKNRRQLTFNYWNTSQSVRDKGDFLGSLHFTAEALPLSDEKDLTKNLLIDIEPFLPQASLQDVFYFPDYISGAAFSPDGKRIATASGDDTVRIIERDSGKTPGPVMPHDAPVYTAVFSADGRWMVTASNDSTARVWDPGSGKAVTVLKHPGAVLNAAFSPDGASVLTACEDGFARLWNRTTGEEVAALQHRLAVTDAVFSPNGKTLLTASNDSTARLWDAATKKELAVFRHKGILRAVAFNHEGDRFLTASSDSTVQLWDSATRKPAHVFRVLSAVNAAALSPDNRWMATAGADGYARLWDLATGRQMGTALKHDGPVFSVAFSKDGKQLLTAGSDKAVRLWTILPPTPASNEVLFKPPDVPTAAVFNADGTRVLTTSYDNTVRLWETATHKQLLALPHSDFVTTAVFSTDGKKILTTCHDGGVRLWDAGNARTPDSFAVNGAVSSGRFSPDGKMIVFADEDRTVYFLDAANLKLADSFRYEANVNSIAWDKKGRTILIAGSDKAARLLDRRSKKPIAVFKHQDLVSTAVFSPDEKMVLTASYDYTARLWDVATKQQIGSAMRHNGEINTAAFSPDGKWIVTTGWDGTTRLWDTKTQKELGTSRKQRDVFSTAVFSPDGTRILAAGRDGFVHLWEIGGDLDIPAGLFQLQAKALTGAELNLGTGETQCLPREQWQPLKEKYYHEGKEHFRTCNYAAYNGWRRFYSEEAQKMHAGVKASQ